MQFSHLVNEIQKLSFAEKEQLHNLLQKYLIEEKRDDIYHNYQMSKTEEHDGKLQFSSNIQELKQMLEDK